MIRIAVAALLLGSCVAAPTRGPAVAVTVSAVPLDSDDPARVSVGPLRYLGGVEIASDDPRFGGISGFRWRDGRLIGVTDAGSWIDIVPREAGGRLTGVASVRIEAMVDPQGRPLENKVDADAEGIDIPADGSRVVSFEREHRFWQSRPGSRPVAVWADIVAALSPMEVNNGIEAFALVGGTRVAFAEAVAEDASGEGVGRGVANARPLAPRIADGFVPTDLDALDDGAALVLLRSFSPMSGAAAQVARLDLATGALAVLATFRPPLAVDNMEALAVRREAGRTFVYLGSDDNFSAVQRTLLLKFELVR